MNRREDVESILLSILQETEYMKQEHEYTVDEYWKLVVTFPNHHYEFVNGFIREVSSRSLAHRQIAVNVTALLNDLLCNSECNMKNARLILI